MVRVLTGYRRALSGVLAAGVLGGGPLTALPAQAGVPVAAARAALVRAAVPGTAVADTGRQVLVTVDRSVSGAAYGRLAAVVRDHGASARIRRIGGVFRPYIAGGDPIYGGGLRCRLGFSVRSGDTYSFLTAGHCGGAGTVWYSDPDQTTEIGVTTDSVFPGSDFSIVRWTGSGTPDGTVDLHNGSSQDITGSGDPTVGERVETADDAGGVHSGTVEALNATVMYEEGMVSGLIQANVCAEPGDSGTPLFDGGKAVGLLSGGADCASGGQTFFQPVQAALDTYGVSVY